AGTRSCAGTIETKRLSHFILTFDAKYAILPFRQGRLDQMEPDQALAHEGMALGRIRPGIVEGADMDVQFTRPPLAFVGEGRAAGGAEAAMDAGRGGEAGEGALCDAHGRSFEAGVGRDR